MNISKKNILKQSNILYLSPSKQICKKSVPILKLFFKKIIYRDTIEKALKEFASGNIHTIVLEIDLYDTTSLKFIKEIRKINNIIPMIIITENKKTEVLLDVIKLNITEYILKPTDINILINALNTSSRIILNSGNIINKIKEGVYYNYLEKTINYNDIENSLTKSESRLFELLIANKNKIIKNEDIRKYIWTNKNVSDSAFKTLFNRLSNKVGKDTITNSFGIGYGIYNK